MFLLKEIEFALGRKVLCVGLLVLLAVTLSPVAHAKANNIRFHNVCDQAFHSPYWRHSWDFKKYMKQGGDLAAWKAVRHNNTELLKRLISENPGLVSKPLLLMQAASDRDPAPLAIFLANGANPNATGDPASLLVAAVSCRRTENVTLLLAAGANVYWKEPVDSENAMFGAIMGGAIPPRDILSPYIQGINLLLAAGYDPRCPIFRKTTALELSRKLVMQHLRSYKVAVKIFEHALMVTKKHASGPPQCGSSAVRAGKG